MTRQPIKQTLPKCKHCKTRFTPISGNRLQPYCLHNEECRNAAIASVKDKAKRKVEKADRAETRQRKEKLKTHKDYLNELQPIFNKYIRLRDANKPCISCGRPLDKKFDAGHFFSVGGNPVLRLHEDNTHGQCVHCNRDKHGNLLEYAERLPERIGQEKFEELKKLKNTVRKYSIPELIDLKQTYKNKIKELE